MTRQVGVGLIGSGFVSAIHAEALARVAGARVVAVASPTAGHAEQFAARFVIPQHFVDYRKLLERPDVDLVAIGAPNDLHAQVTLDAAAAGKHVVVEKPLALNLAEAEAMIAGCRRAGVKLMYAEELCFAPKYVRLKALLDSGALGKPVLIKQSEKHDGPHAPHFWDVERSGGGVTMDMGCHAIQFFRWMLGGAEVCSVYAQMSTSVHAERTRGDDNAILIFEMAGGCTAMAEESWTKPGGMDDRAEVYGSEGVAYADLLRGNSILAYSTRGYDYAVEKAGSTQGWSFAVYEELWNYGFPQEFEHFVDCVANDKPPLVTGDDGRAVLEVLFAAYASAKSGRKELLPFANDAKRPIDLWRAAGGRPEAGGAKKTGGGRR